MSSHIQANSCLPFLPGPPPLTGKTRIVGVFGHPVGHSRSPAMHNAAFQALGLPYVYVPFPVEPINLEQALRALPALGIVGVNLTIPHKEAALSIVDSITDRAREVGAVNTVHCVDGLLLGDNTDGYGFSQPLIEAGYNLESMKVLVLGAGGAARSAVFELARRGATIAIMNRSSARAQALAQAVESCGYQAPEIIASDNQQELNAWTAGSDLILNTTSIGMYPEIDGIPDLQFDLMRPSQLIYDMVYNPSKTRLLAEAEGRGCAVMNGVKMLVYQGAAAFERWTGVQPPTNIMERAVMEGLI